MTKKEEKPKKIIEEVTRYTLKCPYCQKEIKGNSPKNSIENREMHMTYCLKKKEIKNDIKK